MNILAQYYKEIKVGTSWGITLPAIVVSAITILLLIFIVGYIRNVGWKGRIKFFIGIFCILVVCSIAMFHTKPVTEKISTYEVTIDDNVTFNYIWDNFEIKEQRGEIFVLQLKKDRPTE